MPGKPSREEESVLSRLTGLTLSRVPAVEAPFPRRPGPGTLGQPVRLKLNYFSLRINLDGIDCHHYDVTITPVVPARRINRQVVAEAFRQHGKTRLGGRVPAFDGVKNLFTAWPLPAETVELDVSLPDDRPPRAGAPPRDRNFHLVLRKAARVDMEQLQEFLQGRNVNTPQIALQLLDIVMRERPQELLFMDVGRSFFSPQLGPVGQLTGGVESWKGFYQSVRPTQGGLSLNVDMAVTAFLMAGPVSSFLLSVLNRQNLDRPLLDAEKVRVKRLLRTRKVEVTHRGNMRRKYSVSGITDLPLSQLRFPVTREDGQEYQETVVNYFWTTYNKRLELLNMPCLVAGSQSRPNYLPIEVCSIVPGQPYKRKLNDVQTSSILMQAARRPRERENEILQTLGQTSYNNSAACREFGIQVNDKMREVNARILPLPQLEYGNRKTIMPQAGSWNMRGTTVRVGKEVRRWGAVNLSQLPEASFRSFCQDLAASCTTTGLRMEPNPVVSQRGRPEDYEQVLTDLARAAVPPGQKEPNLQIVIVILNANNGPLYGYVKRLCETHLGLVTQVCLSKNTSKGPQYMANVALKINAKVGGSNAFLVPSVSGVPMLPIAPQEATILFGADVTHPSVGDDASPSIAAVVASMDWPGMSQYRPMVEAQPHRLEIIRNLYSPRMGPDGQPQHGGMVRDLLIAFYQANRIKPTRIVFFRDGVSEGQFQEVKQKEVAAVKAACRSLEENYSPRLTFVIVQKRHHTRFFQPDARAQDRSGNAAPGTVVDSEVCHPTDFDFYLQSHAGIQGTSRPCHYHVVHDENRFDSNSMQKFVYHLTYIYSRCTRSVSIVPPAYYAHLLAFRARFYLDAEFSDAGSLPARSAGPPSEPGEQQGSGGTAGASTSSSGRTSRSPADAVVRPLPRLRPSVAATMFFS